MHIFHTVGNDAGAPVYYSGGKGAIPAPATISHHAKSMADPGHRPVRLSP